ncbi:MAG: SpoIID/LytB domain-containing protein [Calditrichia bacterium]|nr:SpoIID/LytB domain-containing protein [Calditrichia bacterium]
MKKTLNFLLLSAILVFIQACAPSTSLRKPSRKRSLIPMISVLISKAHFLHIKFNGEFLLNAPEARYKINDQMGSFWASYENGMLSINSTRRKWHFRSGFPISIKPLKENCYIEIDGKKLIGILKIYSVNENSINYILETDMESYLLGVVPAEIPTGNSEYYQAVQAQAIAARTYALKKIDERKNFIFNIYDDQRDQVLGTMVNVNEIAQKAVQNTSGLILHSNTNNFIPYYHSTCGGVFTPYTDSSYTSTAFDAPHRDSIAYCSISPLYRWHRQIHANKMIDNLINKNLLNYTPEFKKQPHVLNFSVIERNVSGYVEKFGIQIDDTNIKLKNYQIRTTMLDSTNKSLPSNWFLISPRSGDDLSLLIVGAGFGHGKGMCQWGAIAMSMKGFSYQEILKHYYPGAVLKRIYR